MSTDDRLARLGLSHLANDPKKLAEALQAMVAKNRAEEDDWEKRKQELDQELAAKQKADRDAALARDALPPEPVAAAKPVVTPAKPAAVATKPATPSLAKLYDATGGGARDRTQSAAKPAGSKPTSTRSAAPLITGDQFATKMKTLAVESDVAAFLPKLAKLPEQMRILTLEALFGAATKDDVKDIIAQTTSML